MSKFPRRTFLAGLSTIPFALWFEKYAAAAPPMVRYNFNSVNGKKMAKLYANAVKAMMNAPEASPVGWLFQWYTHNVRGDKTKTSEINRVYPTGSFRAPGSYDEFAEKREAFLEAQARQQESVANQVRRETEWLGRKAAPVTQGGDRIDSHAALELQHAQCARPWRGVVHDPGTRGTSPQHVPDQARDRGAIAGAGIAMGGTPFLQRFRRGNAFGVDGADQLNGRGQPSSRSHLKLSTRERAA